MDVRFYILFPILFRRTCRQEHPNHNLHLMTVAPFIVDTGMIKGSIIRFPGRSQRDGSEKAFDLEGLITQYPFFFLESMDKGLINVVSAEKAAKIIIGQMQRKETVIFIPGIYYYINNMIRVLPLRVQLLLTDFIDTGIEIHYDNHDD